MVMKVYSPEFKADAVALYLSDPSHTFEDIGEDMGISRETLRNRVRAERVRHGGGSTTSTEKNTVDSPPTAEELQAENEALRRELATVRKEMQKLATGMSRGTGSAAAGLSGGSCPEDRCRPDASSAPDPARPTHEPRSQGESMRPDGDQALVLTRPALLLTGPPAGVLLGRPATAFAAVAVVVVAAYAAPGIARRLVVRRAVRRLLRDLTEV